MNRSTGCCNIIEILLKTVLNIIQSVAFNLDQSKILLFSKEFMKLLYKASGHGTRPLHAGSTLSGMCRLLFDSERTFQVSSKFIYLIITEICARLKFITPIPTLTTPGALQYLDKRVKLKNYFMNSISFNKIKFLHTDVQIPTLSKLMSKHQISNKSYVCVIVEH